MTSQISLKTNFTAGQVSPYLYARGDLSIYTNGAKTLQNVVILPTGGVSRRCGLHYLGEINPDSRLISFEFNTEQTYLLVFSSENVQVYKDGAKIAEMESVWTSEQLKKINWTQSADTLLIVHPEVRPMQISRNSGEIWKLEEWEFYSKDGQVFCPYYNFYQKKVKLSPSGTSGNITLTADSEIFDDYYIGSRIRINNGEGEITAVTGTKTATMNVTKSLSNTSASTDWEESAFSEKRGYPTAITFHQDRMVIGGSYSLPNHLWLSKSSDLFNFDIGTGLDDEGIDFSILSDQVNAITNVVSGRHLLVFTTGAEWMVSGEPLTPSSIQLYRQTNVGSYNACSLPPQNVDGATLFISQSGKQLREFLYADVEQAYQAKDLTLLATDIIKNPQDITYCQDDSILYVVLQDGTAACLTTYRSEEVNAWGTFVTDGKIKSIAVIGNDRYFAVERGEKTMLEVMDKNFYVDCGITLSSDTEKKIWSGLDYLEGKEVCVIGDGFVFGNFMVENGEIELLESAKEITVGLAYEHIIEPLPYISEGQQTYPPQALRIVSGLFRLLDTKSFCIDIGNGYNEIPLRKMYRDKILDAPVESYTGDLQIRALGWIREMQKPLWSIKNYKPSPFTLLGVVLDVKIKQ